MPSPIGRPGRRAREREGLADPCHDCHRNNAAERSSEPWPGITTTTNPQQRTRRSVIGNHPEPLPGRRAIGGHATPGPNGY